LGRIRTIKPEFFSHYDLYIAEVESKLPLRVAFAGLWTLADREGRFKWEVERLKIGCLPYDKLDFSRVLDALVTRGFIVKYASNGRLYGVIPTFLEHQVINNREKPSAIPSPLEADSSTRGAREGDAWGTPLGNALVEGKGREGKGRGKESRVFDAWNSTPGVVPARKLDLKRKTHLQARLSEIDWDWEAALKKFPLPCFSDGQWTPDFDFFIKPGTVARILEGKYDFTKRTIANRDTVGQSTVDEVITNPEYKALVESRAKEREL
jgi:hypothetical protein